MGRNTGSKAAGFINDLVPRNAVPPSLPSVSAASRRHRLTDPNSLKSRGQGPFVQTIEVEDGFHGRRVEAWVAATLTEELAEGFPDVPDQS